MINSASLADNTAVSNTIKNLVTGGELNNASSGLTQGSIQTPVIRVDLSQQAQNVLDTYNQTVKSISAGIENFNQADIRIKTQHLSALKEQLSFSKNLLKNASQSQVAGLLPAAEQIGDGLQDIGRQIANIFEQGTGNADTADSVGTVFNNAAFQRPLFGYSYAENINVEFDFTRYTETTETFKISQTEEGFEITQAFETVEIVSAQLKVEQSQTLSIKGSASPQSLLSKGQDLSSILDQFKTLLGEYESLLDGIFKNLGGFSIKNGGS